MLRSSSDNERTKRAALGAPGMLGISTLSLAGFNGRGRQEATLEWSTASRCLRWRAAVVAAVDGGRALIGTTVLAITSFFHTGRRPGVRACRRACV